MRLRMISTLRINPDATVRVHLFPADAGGRQTAISSPQYGCPIFFSGQREQGYDCRLLLDQTGAILEPGGPSVVVPVKFLSPELVSSFLRPGARFALWEGKDIGEGEVVQVFGSLADSAD
jgi:hypothetical protein